MLGVEVATAELVEREEFELSWVSAFAAIFKKAREKNDSKIRHIEKTISRFIIFINLNSAVNSRY
jgi:hypothetical protein